MSKKTPPNDRLPLEDTGIAKSENGPVNKRWIVRIFLMVPLLFAVLFTGAVMGMYFQGAGLRAFFEVTGLEPGGGSSQKIAVPLTKVVSESDITALENGAIVALGKLVPEGGVSTIALPYGAGDARIAELHAPIGQWVRKGNVLATLDNRASLETSVQAAEAEVAVSEASLLQVQRSIEASRVENEAQLQRSITTAELAKADLERTRSLFERKVVTQAELDKAKAAADTADQDVVHKRATLKRYNDNDVMAQADVALAKRKLQSAQIALKTAQVNLEKSVVRAPYDGVILDVLVQPGERPSATTGIIEFGNTQRMTAELEIYQNQVGRLQIGDSVLLKAEALSQPLNGILTEVGVLVGRQSVISDDPAANTDARVVTAIVQLDENSSEIAASFTNLEVLGYLKRAGAQKAVAEAKP